MNGKIALTGLLPHEIAEKLGISPAYRARQIYEWIAKGAESFSVMTNLDKRTRESLEETACLRSSRVTDALRDSDGTVKLQITMSDGRVAETVLLTDRNGRKTACVSCQSGCAMGCAFCQTGQLGPGRNLTAGEITEEFLFMEKEAGTLSNIVFMGMGEPMQNLAEIRKAVAVLTDKNGRSLSARRITLSTCGLIEGIYDLADNGPHLRLAVSLTTADPKLRELLMPAAKSNPLPELKKAVQYYAEKSGKRVTLEAALLSGQNTGAESAQRLIEFASGTDACINLIPWNPVPGLEFKAPSKKECELFASMLRRAHLNVTVRLRRGSRVQGACGQLGRPSPADGKFT